MRKLCCADEERIGNALKHIVNRKHVQPFYAVSADNIKHSVLCH